MKSIHQRGICNITRHCPEGLSVVELRGDPGQSPLQVGEHKLQCLGPLLLRVELCFDGVGAAAATSVLDLSFLDIHPETWNKTLGLAHNLK